MTAKTGDSPKVLSMVGVPSVAFDIKRFLRFLPKIDMRVAYKELVPSLKWDEKGGAKGRCPLCGAWEGFSIDNEYVFRCSKCGKEARTPINLYAGIHKLTLDAAFDYYAKRKEITKEVTSVTPIFTEMSMIKTERVEWLWRSYIPLGKICLLDGDPGLGKSLITIDLAARVSSGQPMPDGTKGISGGVVLMALEDGLADTVKPRLEAAGADMKKVIAFEGVKTDQGERLPTIEDLDSIEKAIMQVKAKLLIIDPLMGLLGAKTDSHKDQDIRRSMTPLVKMADRRKIAVVIVRHLNKKSDVTQSIYRGGGSIGIVGIARAGLIVGKDRKNPAVRILAGTKSNLAPLPPSLSYQIDTVRIRSTKRHEEGTPKIEWGGVCDCDADSLLAPKVEKKVTLQDECKSFLETELKNGPRDAKEISQKIDDLGLGYTASTQARAREELGIKSVKRGKRWIWKIV